MTIASEPFDSRERKSRESLQKKVIENIETVREESKVTTDLGPFEVCLEFEPECNGVLVLSAYKQRTSHNESHNASLVCVS